MKIQTQFHLLIAGILIVPIILILGQFLYARSVRMQDEEQAEITRYEDIAAMLDGHENFDDRESLTRFISMMGRFGEIAVFRKDFFVLYSTIPEFTPHVYESAEKIVALAALENQPYTYTLEFLGRRGNQGYILIRRDLSPPRHFQPRTLLPIIFVSALFLFPVIFAIVMSLVIARSITTSVLVLENATRRIAGGELDLKVDVKGSNEITSLTHSLNKMRNALQEAELRRSRFIMGVTHDLKTPLALIKAYTEAIEDGIACDPAAQVSATEIIAAKADQLEGMINDLLEYVQMNSGEWRSQLQRVNIAGFLLNAAREFAPDAELLYHEFQSEIALPGDLFVFMDERLILRALENLVNNAIRYTPNGSVIRLAASLEDGRDGRVVQIVVSDNGPGIDEADLPHIFDMFYRGTSSRREQGMGMGLAVVKWVVDSHGWSLSAGSDQGARFCIAIPLSP
ncbi:MAG: HAMP domain-containing histidine kinase [Treponema sp.]|jgi:signal transduction histidine kinase|nr:HAMP domain-containing histidine kinase [Treponema sp.]